MEKSLNIMMMGIKTKHKCTKQLHQYWVNELRKLGWGNLVSIINASVIL